MTLPSIGGSARMDATRTRDEGVIGRDHDRRGAAAPERMATAQRSSPVIRLVAAVTLVAAVVVACFGLGFVWFAIDVALSRPPADARADGIVVLTGGRDRVQGAIDLLEAGRGRRLLISGVHRSTRAEDIRKAVVGEAALFDCCIDLGHRAETTVGNALEAADWARANGFDSLIVVTSAYHMPRSMVELDRVLPGVRKVAWPVKRPDLAVESWFVRPQTAKLLMQEYVKYMVTRFGGTASLTRPADVATTATIR